MRIGVFDSGIGGEAIARALQQQFPEAEMVVVNDKAHLPYGTKSHEEIISLTDAAIQPLLTAQCDVIVIACNTATTAALSVLRETYPEQFFIGTEPMIKTAAKETKTRTIAVCATPATLSSERYAQLKERFGPSLTYIEPDCSNWASMIEENTISRQHIDAMVAEVLAENADVIVLGCTHYHWIKDEIIEAVDGKATVLEPSESIGRRIKELLI